jgi:hypothetical protein
MPTSTKSIGGAERVPRIHSIHPGFWTDEMIVSVSRDARLFFIGLWNECDDKGAFEWKPVSLKMRLFPVDDLDVVALLGELTRAELVRSYTANGRKYGAVRNFRHYQRPKKPNDLYPMPDAIRDFCGRFRTSGEPVGNQFPTNGEGVTPGEGVGGGSSKGDTPFASLPPKQPHSLNLSLLQQGERDLKVVHSVRRKR